MKTRTRPDDPHAHLFLIRDARRQRIEILSDVRG
jgi:hypothetical protein